MGIAFHGNNFEVEIVHQQVRGMPQEFEVVRRPKIVICVPIAVDGRLILVQQNRVAVGGLVIEFPAGRLEVGESAYEGILRELMEEAGFEVDEIVAIGTIQSAPHFCDEEASVFVARGRLTHEQSPTPKEDIEQLVVRPASAVARMICRGDISDSKTIAAFSVAYGRGLLGDDVW